MPSMPPAPGLFSTITWEPRPSVRRWAMKRAMKSEPPPGANGTMMRTGFDGYGCAAAWSETTSAAAAARRVLIMEAEGTPAAMFFLSGALEADEEARAGVEVGAAAVVAPAGLQ